MAKRDYKKEYAKFQSSPKRKKYRAELNKYNRGKGTYGNGDGKDASHKGGKISGYEAEGKNRGRREKSRLKGSKRKTEGAIMGRQTLREYVREETQRSLREQSVQERLSKRWNIVDAADPRDEVTKALSKVINKRDLERAAREGNDKYIQQVVKRVTVIRHKLDKSDQEQISRVDDVMMNLLRMYMQVKKRARSTNEDHDYLERGQPYKKKKFAPVGKAQHALMKILNSMSGTKQSFPLTVLARRPEFRNIHWSGIMNAANVLKKRGLITFNNGHVQLIETAIHEGKMTRAQVALVDRLRKNGVGKWQDLMGNDEERAASQLANNTGRITDAPRIQYSFGAAVARLLEDVTITEETDRHGGHYNQTYKGWKIYTLQSYDNPYYYATAQRDPKTGKTVFGPSDNYPGLKKLTNRMDKHLKKIGKTQLGEGEQAWGKPEPPTNPEPTKASEPKPITEDPDNPRCSNCTFFESRGGQKGYCGALTQPDVVESGWCKQWNHWSEAPSSLKPGQSRQSAKHRISKSAAQYTNKGPNENVSEDGQNAENDKMIKLKSLVPEGFMGWEHYEESDTASDHYHTLKDLYQKNKNDAGRLLGDFKRWLNKLDRDKGNEYNLTGYQALALISKEPLFSDVAQATQPHSDVRRYARKAYVELQKDIQHAKKLGREGVEQLKGLQGMLKSIKTWA